MAQGRVVVLNEVKSDREGWNLCFQYCRYEYGNGDNQENGYRFIWRKPNGNLQGARGQARIPSISDILFLTGKAIAEGWGSHMCGPLGYSFDEEE